MACTASFQPTYEELKPSWLTQLRPDLGGFQPTYEELKPPLLRILFIRPRRFQPTYEELKHEKHAV